MDAFENVFPKLADLSTAPRRIILHWTAGRHTPNGEDLLRYNALIRHVAEEEWDLARLIPGVPVARNMGQQVGKPPAHRDPTQGYAAHTGGFNSYSIGVSLCGMFGAVDRRPVLGVDPGASPITDEQVWLMVRVLAMSLKRYSLEPIGAHLFDHWEAEHLHGVQQRGGVWDLQWIPVEPGLQRGEAGHWIRDEVARELRSREIAQMPALPRWEPRPAVQVPPWPQRLREKIHSWFRRTPA